MTRYDLLDDGSLIPSSDGDIVHFDDVEELTEENAKLREALESIRRMQSRTPELPDNYSHEDVGNLNDRIDEIFGKVNTALNQIKEQDNDR